MAARSSCSGGVVLENEDGTVIHDLTFDTLLRSVRETSLKAALRNLECVSAMYAQPKKGKRSGSAVKARYAYGTARVHAMKVKLFPKETYSKLVVMALPEITRFIEESEYKAEVDELARMYSGIDLVEFATHLNLARTFTKLMEMTMGEPHELIVEYLRRWDIWDIKTILRGKTYGASDEEIVRILVPSGELSREYLQTLVRKPSVEEVIAALKGTVYYDVIKDIDYAESSMKVEDELDKFYYARMVDLVSKITRLFACT